MPGAVRADQKSMPPRSDATPASRHAFDNRVRTVPVDPPLEGLEGPEPNRRRRREGTRFTRPSQRSTASGREAARRQVPHQFHRRGSALRFTPRLRGVTPDGHTTWSDCGSKTAPSPARARWIARSSAHRSTVPSYPPGRWISTSQVGLATTPARSSGRSSDSTRTGPSTSMVRAVDLNHCRHQRVGMPVVKAARHPKVKAGCARPKSSIEAGRGPLPHRNEEVIAHE